MAANPTAVGRVGSFHEDTPESCLGGAFGLTKRGIILRAVPTESVPRGGGGVLLALFVVCLFPGLLKCTPAEFQSESTLSPAP